jgi:adenosine deaminase
MTQIPDAWYYDLPKVELHVHLEGSIPLDTLWELIQQYGGDPSVPTRDALTERFQYTDFAHFIQTWVWKNRFIRTLADFTRIAEAVAHDYASQNIRYVEAHYSPTDFRTLGFTISEITQAIRTGLDRCPDTTVMLICDVVRDSPVERAMATVHAVAQLRHLGVVGIGLGGSEQSHPPEPFAPVFALARTYRLHTTVHAGEAAGPASIWGAIHALQPERIGHAGRAIEDPTLVAYYQTHRVALECCPLSNIRTNVFADMVSHPVGRFIAAGLVVTINTDDPKMFHNTLADEYRALVETHGLDQAAVCRLIDTAISVSWLSDAAKAALRTSFHTHPTWIDSTLPDGYTTVTRTSP